MKKLLFILMLLPLFGIAQKQYEYLNVPDSVTTDTAGVKRVIGMAYQKRVTSTPMVWTLESVTAQLESLERRIALLQTKSDVLYLKDSPIPLEERKRIRNELKPDKDKNDILLNNLLRQKAEVDKVRAILSQ